MAGYSNRGGTQAAPIIVTNPSDEVKFPPITLAPMTDPTVHPTIGVGISAQLTMGKPVNIYELYGNARGGHLWFPSVSPIGGIGNGKLVAFLSLNDDTFENFTDEFAVIQSHDGGDTWDQDSVFDQSGFSNGPARMRRYDDETGRIYSWNAFKMQPDPYDGQRLNFRCEFGYYSLTSAGKVKYTSYPHGATFTGLPLPVTADPWSGLYPQRPRNSWAALFGESKVTERADGRWIVVLDGELENPENPSGQDDYFTGFLFESTNRRDFTFVDYVNARESGISECTTWQGPSGKLVCCYNNFGPDRGGLDGANKITISNDSTGVGWGASFHPDPPNWIAGGRIGSCAPVHLKLADGSIIIAAGRTGNDSHNLSVNIDGGDSVDSVWGWISLVGHHNAYANDGGTDLASASGDPGLIHEIRPNPSRSQCSTCYTDMAHLGGNEFFLIWDYTPQVKQEIGAVHGHLPNVIYGCRASLQRL